MKTILSLRKWQIHLPANDYGTQFAEWMRQLYQAMLGLLPIYFDRIRVFATQLYGFDTSLLLTMTNGNAANPAEANAYDCDGIVKKFLLRQEKLGGPSMAVALVLDAVATSNVHVERGVRLSTSVDGDGPTLVARMAWPAIYLRSTRHASSIPPPPPSASSGSGLFRSSQAAILSNWSSAGSVNSSPLSALIGGRKTMRSPSSGSSFRKSVPSAAVSAVLEYGPDTGTATTWPHNDWDAVADLLSRREALSNKALEFSIEEDIELLTVESEVSTIYTAPLSSSIHLVVMEVKEEETVDDRHRLSRKLELSRPEIQKFLLERLVPRLRPLELFAASCQKVSLDVPRNSNPTLLPPNRFRARNIKNDQLRNETRDAACFFLGPDLASTLDD
jgi:hypothetical protein